MKKLFLVLLICLCAGSVLGQSFFGIPGFKMKNGFLHSRTTDSIYFVDSTGADTTLLFYHDGADWQWAGASVPLSDSTGKLDTTYAGFTTYVSNHSVAAVDSVLHADTSDVAKDLEAVDDIALNGFDIRTVDGIFLSDINVLSNSSDINIRGGTVADILIWEAGNLYWTFQSQYLIGEAGTIIQVAEWQGATVTVPYGGTGAPSLTDHAVLLGSGTNSITPLPVLHDGDIIIGVTGSDPGEIHGAFTSPTGVLIHEHGGLEDDVSGYTNGLYGMLSSVTADIDTEAELETALGGINVIVETEIDASAKLLNIVTDETGTGSLVFSIAPTFTSTTNFQHAIVNQQLIADTITAALQFSLPRGDGSDAHTVVNGNGEIVIDEDADGADFDEGLLKYWSGSDSMFAMAFVCSTHTPNDNDVAVYDAANNRILWEAQIGASGEANTLVDTGTFNDSEGFGIAGVKQGTVLFTKGLIEGANIVITASGDTGLVIAGPAASGTADSTGWDTTGNGANNGFQYSTTAGAMIISEGANIAFHAYNAGGSLDSVVIQAADTVSESGDVDTSGTKIAAALDDRQDESAVLTDIADGTINTDLDNTQYPWADNEVSPNLTVNGYMEDTDIDNFTKLQSWISDATLLNTDSVAQIDAVWTLSADFVNTSFPWADDEVASSGNWNAAHSRVASDSANWTAAHARVDSDSANWTDAYDHSQDNTQAHTDYLLNSESDVMTGTLTADGLTLGANENITLGGQTLDHDGTNFVFSDPISAEDSIVAPKVVTTGGGTGTFTVVTTSNGTIALTGPDSTTGDYEYVLPTSFGSAAQQLTDNGSGVLYWANAGAGGVAYADSAGATGDVMSFDTVWVGVSPPDAAVANFTTTKPGYFMQEPDAHFGNATVGMIEIGDAVIALGARDTTYNSGALDLGGAMVFRQTVEPDGPFEFVFYENGGDIRLGLPKSGPGLATWNSRSMVIAGPSILDDTAAYAEYWGFTKADFDTDASGADLGVQDDLEVMGKVYVDTLDNITAAPIEILADVDITGNLGVSTTDSGIVLLHQVGHPTADVEFDMSNKSIKFDFGGNISGHALEVELGGNSSADGIHIHQHGGNPTTGHLLHVEADDADVIPATFLSGTDSVVVFGSTDSTVGAWIDTSGIYHGDLDADTIDISGDKIVDLNGGGLTVASNVLAVTDDIRNHTLDSAEVVTIINDSSSSVVPDSSGIAGILSGLGAGGRVYWKADTLIIIDSTGQSGLLKGYFNVSNSWVWACADGTVLDGGEGVTTVDSLVAERAIIDSTYIAARNADSTVMSKKYIDDGDDDGKHFRFNLANPNGLQDTDAEWSLVPVTPADLTITRIDVTLDADPTTDIEYSIKFADAFIGLGSATVIEDTATVDGVTTVESITGDATVPAGKCIYFLFESTPDEATTQMSVDITYDFD